jgi:hypothetical protein
MREGAGYHPGDKPIRRPPAQHGGQDGRKGRDGLAWIGKALAAIGGEAAND